MFVARAVGRSMEPMIHSGDYLVFRRDPVDAGDGRIVLARYQGSPDPETGGMFTVTRCALQRRRDGAGLRTTSVLLSPLNRDFQPIVVPEEAAADFRVVAELVTVLGG